MSRAKRYAPNTLRVEKLWSGCQFSAVGVLDDNSVAVQVFDDESGFVAVTIGPVKLTISSEAAAELARHLSAAAEAAEVVGGDE